MPRSLGPLFDVADPAELMPSLSVFCFHLPDKLPEVCYRLLHGGRSVPLLVGEGDEGITRTEVFKELVPASLHLVLMVDDCRLLGCGLASRLSLSSRVPIPAIVELLHLYDPSLPEGVSLSPYYVITLFCHKINNLIKYQTGRLSPCFPCFFKCWVIKYKQYIFLLFHPDRRLQTPVFFIFQSCTTWSASGPGTYTACPCPAGLVS